MFDFFSFAIYNVEFVLLSSYVVCQNNLLICTRLFDGFIPMEAFAISADNHMDINQLAEFFPIL